MIATFGYGAADSSPVTFGYGEAEVVAPHEPVYVVVNGGTQRVRGTMRAILTTRGRIDHRTVTGTATRTRVTT
jgi:hypothetical protein